jgi:DNA helicase-2/ATP-dependent DNA helicase PcrA
MERNGIEEERRLMYVAITRAKNKLFLTHAKERLWHGSYRRAIASRFFREIDPESYETIAKNKVSSAAASPSFSSSLANTKADTTLPFAIGQKVHQAKFGEGTVLRYEGKAAQLKIEVRFARAGTKWLSLAHAKLSNL